MRWITVGSAVALAAAAALGQGQAPASRTVAAYEGGTVTETDLAGVADPALIRARQQLYEAEAEAARELAFRRLLARRAAAEGVRPEELLERRLAELVAAPDPVEVQRVLARFRSQLPADEESARAMVVDALENRGRQEALRRLRDGMLEEAGFRLLLEPPRVPVPVAVGEPAKGPEDAPVTIVEFADYQCPFCARVQGTLAELERRYPGKIRLVVKDLPLAMHPDARRAAEAAACAAEQGKFWELHDWMYANQSMLDEEGLARGAEAVGLDVAAFAACRESGRHRQEVAADERLAARLGVESTPTFFVNGRLIEGAQPLERFVEVVEDELRRAGEGSDAETAAGERSRAGGTLPPGNG